MSWQIFALYNSPQFNNYRLDDCLKTIPVLEVKPTDEIFVISKKGQLMERAQLTSHTQGPYHLFINRLQQIKVDGQIYKSPRILKRI